MPTPSDPILRHCLEIDRCNQRGGRMLSVVDLIEAGTFGRELAAYALAVIGRGASFLVGAAPGGAGKTTVMGALLNFVPLDVELTPADALDVIERGSKSSLPRRCYVCHEIGSGDFYAYLWGCELRAYFALAAAGHLLATNLHADTYEQARSQICDDNKVPDSDLRRMNVMLFLSVRRRGPGPTRRIEEVWESDGRSPHRLVFKADLAPPLLIPSALASAEEIARAARIIDLLFRQKARTIEDVRSLIVSRRTV